MIAMEERNVKLSLEKAKEWYKKGGELKEVALQAYKEEELKDNRPHSWREFCDMGPVLIGEAYISINSKINVIKVSDISRDRYASCDRNFYPRREYAEAALALAQLLQLRQVWIGNWEPDWKQDDLKWCIISFENSLTVFAPKNMSSPLSFPDNQMAEEFLKDFRDLLETAKPLL